MAQPTKKELIAKLTELNIEHNPEATNAVLAALLPADAFANEPVEDTRTEVTVSYQDPTKGPSERVFSREIHGDKFLDLAKMFSEKYSGTIL